MAHREWALQDAKNRLSELVALAREEGPQTITRHGKQAAVVLSIEEYRRLCGGSGSLVEFFRKSPLVGVELDLQRSQDPGVDLWGAFSTRVWFRNLWLAGPTVACCDGSTHKTKQFST